MLPLLLALPPAAGAMIAVAMSLGIFIVGLMFAVAYAMQNPQLIALAREELAALIFSAIIIMFWVGSDALFNGLVSGIIISTLPPSLQGFASSSASMGGLTSSHVNLAMASLNIMEAKLKEQYTSLYLYEALIGFLSTISFPLGSPMPGVCIISFSVAPFTGLAMLSNAHTNIVETIGYIITVVWSKQFILIFTRDVVPVMLFPLGLILRAVPFYRKTGSSVIAVAFALYFVMPFAMLFSNYLIFDLFKPSDFTYTPSSASYFGTDRDRGFSDTIAGFGQSNESKSLLDQFMAPSVVNEASDDASDACVGNSVVKLLCSVKNVMKGAYEAAKGFIGTVWSIWRFMVGMTGDFVGFWTNPMMPASASAGLYYFLIREVITVTPFIILIMITTVFEILITVTAYRSISLLIGGEAEIVGLTKVV